MGTCTVQLDALLDNRIGIRGWLPIRPLVGNHILSSLIDETKAIGGLEIAVRFCKSDDYVRVVNAAEQIGWRRTPNGNLPVTKDYVSSRNVAPRSAVDQQQTATTSSNVAVQKESKSTGQHMSEQNSGEKSSVKCLVEIERAVHLASVYEAASNRHMAPNAFVSFRAGSGTGAVVGESRVCARQISPYWNYQLLVALAAEYFLEDNKYFVLKVFHRADSPVSEERDKLLGNVSIDLQPLICGLTHISGWYNIQV